MKQTLFQPEITADATNGGHHRSLQYLFDDIFAPAPAAQAAAVACAPFSNNTPPPSDQTPRDPPLERVCDL